MKKTDIKLIALDLDDTALKSDGSLASETRDAIVRAIEEGIEIVVASGRAYGALHKDVIAIPGIRYAVTSNGSSVYRLSDGERIAKYCLPEEAVEQILEYSEPYVGIAALEAFVDGIPYTSYDHIEHPEKHGCSPAYVPYVQKTRTPVDDIEGFARKHAKELDSMVVACADKEIRDIIKGKIAENIKDVQMTSSVPHLIEIIHVDAGKDAGLEFICRMLNIDRKDTVACGNADNDIDMMKFAGLGVSVSNGSRNCRESADLIIGNNNDNSVAEFINDICDGKY